MAPMRLVLAGTPDVQDVLSAADATFADRMGKLPIGLLEPAAGVQSDRGTFADHEIVADDGVVEHLAGGPTTTRTFCRWLARLPGRKPART